MLNKLLGMSRYRQTSLFFTLLVTALATSMIAHRIRIDGIFRFDQIASTDGGLFVLFALAFSVLLFLPDRRYAHLLQVGLLMIFGAVTVFFVAPTDLGGDLAFILAGTVAYRYGLLDTRRLLKLSGIMGMLVLTRLAAVFYYPDINLSRAINQIIIVSFTIPFLYLVFERDFLQTQREKKILETAREQNRPFVEFGRNVSGIVHDFKNDLSLLSSYAEFLHACEWEPLEPRHVVQLDGYIGRFRRRVERLLFVTRKRGCRDDETFDLAEAVRAALYVFETSLDFRKHIVFNCSCPAENTTIRSSPDELLAILENLIRNSCEAIVRARQEGPGEMRDSVRVDLSIDRSVESGHIAIIVADDGPGLQLCGGANGDETEFNLADILDSPSCGFTPGLGLKSVHRSAVLIGADVRLSSARNRGTRVTVVLPKSSFLPDAVDS